MIIYRDRDKFCISGYVYSVKKLLNTKKKIETERVVNVSNSSDCCGFMFKKIHSLCT